MISVGEDKGAVHAGLVCVFSEAASRLYGMEKASLAWFKGVKVGANYFAGDVDDDFGGWGWGGEGYLQRVSVTASHRRHDQGEGEEEEEKVLSGGRQLCRLQW